MKIYKNLIIGGGAAGLMFAGNLRDKKDTIIIDGNSKLGAKIFISGGGKCNFTNRVVKTSNYLAKDKFLKNLIKEYSSEKIFNYFSKKDLKSTLKNESQYFCKSSSTELLDILLKDIKGVEIALNTKVTEVVKQNSVFEIKTTKGSFFTKKLIVTSGGLSFPKIGATSIGLDIAKSFGHKVETTNPALVGFTLQPSEAFFKELSGVSLDVEIKVDNRALSGSLLFAHKGISGPVILNSSLFWSKGVIEINFLPKFNLDSIKSSKKSIINLLPMPKRVAKAFLNKLELEDKKATLLTKQDYEKLKLLQSYKFAPAGTFGYSRAEVTKGGINTDEIDNTTFESKVVSNLYFLGEVLDVTGMLGGYNFHFAFASALSCVKGFNKEL